jgi:predicted neuraminidase
MNLSIPLALRCSYRANNSPTNLLSPALASWFHVNSMFGIAVALLSYCSSSLAAQPFYRSELVFPLENFHNHASCILELPNGEMLVTWYHGSGEHEADDVKIMGARWAKGEKSWSRPFVMADTLKFPDGNPVIFLDRQKQLWLVWPVIVANDWRTTIFKYQVATDYRRSRQAPKWKVADILLFASKDFTEEVQRGIDRYIKANSITSNSQRIESLKKLAADKYASRMGWITRSRPLILPTGRILIPIYSDGFSISMMALSDDGGNSWTTGKPIIGLGNIQPSVVRKNNGTLVAYMRNAGPPPRRLYTSNSTDGGVTWSLATHTNLPNPGSAADIIRLVNGYWAIVYNDSEEGRHSLAVSLSDDEGKSWRWTRHLELEPPENRAGQFHYPSTIQTRDGLLHVSYSYFLNHLPLGEPRKSIKHAAFNFEWVQAGDAPLTKIPR